MLSLALFGLIATLTTDGRAQKIFAKTEFFREEDSYLSENRGIPTTLPDGNIPSAEACGAPVPALEGGLVVEVKDGGWNEGRGSYVKVEGGRITAYLHLENIYVEVGQMVEKEDILGSVGRSGLVDNSVCVREAE